MRDLSARLRRTPRLMTNQDHFDFIHFRGVAQGNYFIRNISFRTHDQSSNRVTVGIAKWPHVLGEAYRCLKPGAYIELSEIDSKLGKYFYPSRNLSDPLLALAKSDDGSLKEDNPLAQFGRLLDQAMGTSGRVAPSEKLLRERLEKAGYVDVQSFKLKLPVGPWAKELYEPCIAVCHR
jgi:hypothetical protein